MAFNPQMSPFDGLDLIRERKEEEELKIPLPPEVKKQKKRKSRPKPTVQEPPEQKVLVEDDYPEPRRPKKKAKRLKKEVKQRDEDDRNTIALLTGYGSNQWLGPYLRDTHGFQLEPAKLRKLSKAKLQELVEDVEDVLSNKSNAAMGDMVVRDSMYTLEALVSHKTPAKVQGTTDKCFENDHWRFLLERVKTKYNIGMKLSPVTELTLVTLSTAKLVHDHNKMEEPELTSLDELVDEDEAMA